MVVVYSQKTVVCDVNVVWLLDVPAADDGVGPVEESARNNALARAKEHHKRLLLVEEASQSGRLGVQAHRRALAIDLTRDEVVEGPRLHSVAQQLVGEIVAAVRRFNV